MKRIGNLYNDIISIDNLKLADQIARKGKKKQYGVINHIKNEEQNIWDLHISLRDKTYNTGEYKTFTVYEPKERIVYKLDYIHRIVHHAIMNYLEKMFVSSFTKDTYACIKGRGILKAANSIQKCLNEFHGTPYCLKLDIRKFYPSVDHEILKSMLRRKIKDNDLLWLLDEIIDSAPGLPIGNYLSQYFSNFYLSPLDHFLKEDLKVKNYWRYADDIIIVADNIKDLHYILYQIKDFIGTKLNLDVKDNYQCFPVGNRGIDTMGYVFRKKYRLLRKSIKKRFARMLIKNDNQKSRAGYNGWVKHCNSRHLIKKLYHEKV